MNFSTEKKFMDLENSLVVPGGGGGEGGGFGVWGDLIIEFKLLPLDWINNEILLCSTENYV